MISLLKRWLLRTHQGAVSSAHLDYCLDEFTFGSINADRAAETSYSSDLRSKQRL